MNTILSNNNKEILWNTLYKNNIFNNIPNDSFNEIKNIFENNINQVVSNIQTNELSQQDVLKYNKLILKNVSNEIMSFKQNYLKSTNTKSLLINERKNIFEKI